MGDGRGRPGPRLRRSGGRAADTDHRADAIQARTGAGGRWLHRGLHDGHRRDASGSAGAESGRAGARACRSRGPNRRAARAPGGGSPRYAALGGVRRSGGRVMARVGCEVRAGACPGGARPRAARSHRSRASRGGWTLVALPARGRDPGDGLAGRKRRALSADRLRCFAGRGGIPGAGRGHRGDALRCARRNCGELVCGCEPPPGHDVRQRDGADLRRARRTRGRAVEPQLGRRIDHRGAARARCGYRATGGCVLRRLPPRRPRHLVSLRGAARA